ncbi:hypothetical protein K435DRAFT_808330 [Dendrothele bispora CBS 962.96]|uniref:Uncharacterized protein n=1 Tax=Dendrothele bispora (strain CBS 962.96) TaxID=1314807 RepID=A0A4S8L1U9_DENBC|nr:hypothetical protein K435DRAFT_808330 [Dendrothele bispora CBS 962.96]
MPPRTTESLPLSDLDTFNLTSGIVRTAYLLSDGIVIWRAWILCPSNPLLKLAMCICMILSCIGIFLDMGLTAQKLLRDPVNFGAKTKILLMVVPLLVTNLGATSVIIYKMINMGKFSTDKTHISALKTIFMVLTLLNGRESVVYQAFASGMPIISAIYPLFIIIIAASQNQRSNRSHRQLLENTAEEETGTLGLVSGSAVRQ